MSDRIFKGHGDPFDGVRVPRVLHQGYAVSARPEECPLTYVPPFRFAIPGLTSAAGCLSRGFVPCASDWLSTRRRVDQTKEGPCGRIGSLTIEGAVC